MSLINEPLPITEPYPATVKPVLETKWEKEKDRLEEEGMTIPQNVEALARRMFMAGYVSAINSHPF